MDLLQSVRKEGSRGGVNFSWDDVRSNPRRETYLGHSLMAPVGRWQKNKDLNWYAKADEAELTAEERAERERERKREEVRKIKEAEEDAMKRAMGLPVPDRTNANLEPLGVSQVDVNKALKEALDDGEEDNAGKGVGFGSKAGVVEEGKEVMKGSRGHDERRRDRSRSRERRRDRAGERGEGRRHRSRSQSADRDRERRRRHRHRDRSRSREGERRHRRSRSRHGDDGHRSRRHDHDDRPRSRDRDRHERRRSQDKEKRRHRSRSRSPHVDSRRRRDE